MADIIRYTSELSSLPNASDALRSLVMIKHGMNLALPWPRGWYFTYWNVTEYLKEDIGVRLIRQRYVCCNKYLVAIGIVHPKYADIMRQHPIVLLGECDSVYVYDQRDALLYLVSTTGFDGFLAVGLQSCTGIRERLIHHNDFTSDVALQRLAMAGDISTMISIRDSLLMDGNCIFCDRELACTLKLCATHMHMSDSNRVASWLIKTGVEQLEPVMILRQMNGTDVLMLYIFVDGTMSVYGVDAEGDIHFLALNLMSFYKIGAARYGCVNVYMNGCYGKGGSGSASTYVPKCFFGDSCRRIGEVKRIRRGWRRFFRWFERS